MSPDNESPAEDVSLGIDEFPWASGVVTGIVTFLLGYLAFFASSWSGRARSPVR